MNELIESLLRGFRVNGECIPFAYLYYEGHDDTYIVYSHNDSDNSFDGDDDLLGYADYYDFDVYSKGNYLEVIEGLKALLKANDFVWQVSRTSPDYYETDTKYYHKTLNFSILREV